MCKSSTLYSSLTLFFLFFLLFRHLCDHENTGVFSFLDGQQICSTAALVCKKFAAIAQDDYLWYLVVKKYTKRKQQTATAQKKEETVKVGVGQIIGTEGGVPATHGSANYIVKEEANAKAKLEKEKPQKQAKAIIPKPEDRNWKWLYRCKTVRVFQVLPQYFYWFPWPFSLDSTYVIVQRELQKPHVSKVNGVGCYLWEDAYYEGEWKDGQPDGKGIKCWSEHGTYPGNSYITSPSPSLSHTHTHPRLALYWMILIPQKKEFYMGEWKNGRMNGQGSYRWPDGSSYSGHWEDSFHHGFGTYIWYMNYFHS